MGYWPVQFSSDKVFVQSIFQISTWKVFLLKIYLLWKIWPISVKRWKPVWVRACLCTLLWSVRLCSQSSMAPHQRRPAFTRRETSGRLYFLSWSQKSSTVTSEPNFGPPPPPLNQIFLDLPLTSRFPCIHSIPKHCVHPHSALKSRIPAFKYKVNTGLQKPIGKPLFWWVRRLTWLKWGLKSVLV